MSVGWIVHISDLHIGAQLSGGGFLGGTVPKASGHELRALQALSSFLEVFITDHPSPSEPKLLVVSGDATALGDPDEFAIFRTLLEMGLCIDAYRRIPPLGLGFDRVVELPGNHDYWDGTVLNPVVSRGPRIRFFRSHVPATMKIGSREVVVHTLCSTIGASRMEQLLAVGAYDQKEVADLDAKLGSRNVPGVDHFIVTHHSPSHGSSIVHGISQAAETALENLHGSPRTSVPALPSRTSAPNSNPTYRVRGLLSGHAHKTHVALRGKLPPEARSATTLQASVPPGMTKNGFLLHRLEDRGTHLGWTPTEYLFDGGKFVPTFTYPPIG